MEHSTHSSNSSDRAALIPRPSAALRAEEPYYANDPRYRFEKPEDAESTNTLAEYWRAFRLHKTTILFAALGGLVLGFLVGIPMKPVYRAQTSVEVLNINEDFMNMKQSNPINNNDGSFETSEEETQAKLLQSSALLERVHEKLISSNAVQTNKLPRRAASGWRGWLHMSEPVEMGDREKLFIKAAGSLKVHSTPRTRVLEVTVDSKDPQFSAEFANTLVQEFIQRNLEARWNTTQRTSDWLRREIDGARAKLQTSEDALQAYARVSGLIFTADSTNVATEKLQQVQQALSTATVDRISKQARFELAKSSPPDSLPDVLGDEGLQETSSKLVDLRRKVAALSATFNPGYSKLKETLAELAAMQEAFQHHRADVLKRVDNEYQQAISDEKLLIVAYQAQVREVTGQSEKEIQYNILKREVDSSRQLYDTMLQQTKQASIASAMRASNVRVVDPAQVSYDPISPNFKLNSALGLLTGLAFSMVFVVVRERSDRTLQQPGDVKLWANLPELGTIPNVSTAIKGPNRKPATASLADAHFLEKGTEISRRELNVAELITWQNKPSVIAEAFRSALTSIFFVGENGSRPRVLVFTSASPGDGKTTVVSNLAIANAEIRHKVLIIDADLRRPRMHDIFGLPNARGLADLLHEEISDENIASLIRRTAISGLDVITGGSPTQSAAHLLYSPNFATLLTKLRREYDMILIDTPPMLQMTDARVVGRLADAVVLVARAGCTTRDSLLAAKDRFAEDRIRVLGTILNDWDLKRSPIGYYSSYRNGYYGEYGPTEATAKPRRQAL